MMYKLIFQEPTSGLDAAIACSLIKNIKNLAETQQRAVITTIHQPSSHVFHMFDKLLLLCNGQVSKYIYLARQYIPSNSYKGYRGVGGTPMGWPWDDALDNILW